MQLAALLIHVRNVELATCLIYLRAGPSSLLCRGACRVMRPRRWKLARGRVIGVGVQVMRKWRHPVLLTRPDQPQYVSDELHYPSPCRSEEGRVFTLGVQASERLSRRRSRRSTFVWQQGTDPDVCLPLPASDPHFQIVRADGDVIGGGAPVFRHRVQRIRVFVPHHAGYRPVFNDKRVSGRFSIAPRAVVVIA